MTQVHAHQIAVVPEYHQYGRRFDDGQPVIGDRYFVVYENDQGYRWRHHFWFDGLCQVTDDDSGEGPFFQNQHDEALARAQRLVDRIIRSGEINLEYWQLDRPAYGSQAWVESGQDLAEILTERMEDSHDC